MHAVLLAAGRSTRFYPFNNYYHKSLVPLLGKPLIVHTIESIKKSGITTITIVVEEKEPFLKVLGEGKNFGVSINYIIHKGARGMGHALLDAKDTINGPFFLANPYHVNFSEFKDDLEKEQTTEEEVVLLTKKTDSVQEYGTITFENKKVTSLVEKPKESTTNYRVIGIYLLSEEFLTTLASVESEHYSFEKALDLYAKAGKVSFIETEKETATLKYAWDLLSIKDLLLASVKSKITNFKNPESVSIEGSVVIEDGVTIHEGVSIKGPAYIGKNAVLGNNVIIRNNTSIEEGVVVGAGMEVKNSILFSNATTHAGFIGDSIIGNGTKIGTDFVSTNVKLNREQITVSLPKGNINTGRKYLGTIIGEKAVLGARVTTMPGVVIGSNSMIGPGTVVLHSVEEDKRYYTKFTEVIEEKTKKREKIVLFDIDYTLFDTDAFKKSNQQTHTLYKEVAECLQQLQPIAKVGIFSEGVIEFQKNKITQTDIEKFLTKTHIHVVEQKSEAMKEILANYTDCDLVLIDDRLPILHMARLFKPDIFTIWVKRGKFAETQEDIPGFTPDETVLDLQNVVRIISSL